MYDAGGRLTRETTPADSRTYDYDAAGQLLSVSYPDGTRTEYVHDGLGRRTGSSTRTGPGPSTRGVGSGYLESTAERTPDGVEIARHELWVDALGELAAIDGTELWWDTATPIPTLIGHRR